MKELIDQIKTGQVPIHLKSLIKKPRPTYLTKTRVSKIFHTNGLQLDLYYKSPI